MSISTEEIEAMIVNAIPDSRVTVQGVEGKYQVQVISDFFEGLNAVKRQQAVYRILNPHISSGVIHAVSMRLMTSSETM